MICNFLKSITSCYWSIGFCSKKDVLSYRFEDISWVKTKMPYGGIADPFILCYDEDIIKVLVEEIPKSGKGQISIVTIDRKKNEVIECQPLLVLDTHLSFPVVVHEGEVVYIYPENSASGQLSVYILDNSLKSCKLKNKIIDKPLTDAVIFYKNGFYYLYTTVRCFSNKNKFEIYQSKEHFGNFQFVKEVVMPSNTARNAGKVIEERGKYYKVSQENDSSIYGHGIVIYEIIDDSSFVEVNRIEPAGFMFLGIHTMNEYKDLVVFDCKRYRFIIGAILSKIKKKLSILH